MLVVMRKAGESFHLTFPSPGGPIRVEVKVTRVDEKRADLLIVDHSGNAPEIPLVNMAGEAGVVVTTADGQRAHVYTLTIGQQRVRLGISADRSVEISRPEYEAANP